MLDELNDLPPKNQTTYTRINGKVVKRERPKPTEDSAYLDKVLARYTTPPMTGPHKVGDNPADKHASEPRPDSALPAEKRFVLPEQRVTKEVLEKMKLKHIYPGSPDKWEATVKQPIADKRHDWPRSMPPIAWFPPPCLGDGKTNDETTRTVEVYRRGIKTGMRFEMPALQALVFELLVNKLWFDWEITAAVKGLHTMRIHRENVPPQICNVASGMLRAVQMETGSSAFVGLMQILDDTQQAGREASVEVIFPAQGTPTYSISIHLTKAEKDAP